MHTNATCTHNTHTSTRTHSTGECEQRLWAVVTRMRQSEHDSEDDAVTLSNEIRIALEGSVRGWVLVVQGWERGKGASLLVNALKLFCSRPVICVSLSRWLSLQS